MRAPQSAGYLIYSEADFEDFRPTGATRCTDGSEIWHGGGPLLRAKFHPHRCNDKGIGPLKLKILLIFGQNVEYIHPAGAYPLCDFHKICRICSTFQDALAVKVSLNLLKGLWSYGHFNLTGSGYPKISSGETMRQTPKRFRGETTCSRSSITMPSLVAIGFHPPPGRRKTLSFFVCPSRFFCHACDVTLVTSHL